MFYIGDTKAYTLEEILDRDLGPVGTPRRDKFEGKLEEELKAYHIGEAIRKARKEKHLTQAQLGELIGVQRAQVSKIERGKSLSLNSVARVFHAMNIPATLTLGNVTLSLW